VEGFEDPATGQRFIFRSTADDSVVFESFLPARAWGLASARHAQQEQRFEVLHGSLLFRVGTEETLLVAGDRLQVPRGTRCRYRNPSSEPAHLVAELRPALDFDAFARAHCERRKH
jgi:mannose-6-phosphate isomerase-like protein (cupin superfamily)